MTQTETTSEQRRFGATIRYYARYRTDYPLRLIARTAEIAGLAPGDCVLDLGCGPGLLALSFAAAGMEVTGVDPEPGMVAAARAAAEDAGLTIDFREGSSFAMPAGLGMFKLVVMGRAFHWMDRPATLRMLDGMIAPDGALALFDDDHPHTVENAWMRLLRDVSARYGAEAASHRAARQSPSYRNHLSILLDSPFRELESAGVLLHRPITVDEIIGRAYSLSVTSIDALGPRRDAFEAEMRAALATLSPEGRFVEMAEMTAWIAKRA